MTVFRPCIDLHHGQVKQIVGGTLDTSDLKTNFVSKHPPKYYAELYRDNNLLGGHVIKLGPGNDQAAKEALAAWPNKLHVGGGINEDNAQEWLDAGAEKVIVTSYLFPNARFDEDRLQSMSKRIGKERLVVDVRRGDKWVVAMNRWQDLTDMEVNQESIRLLEQYCSEFLIHAADVEGLCQGIDEKLVQRLGEWCSIPTVYAGGAKSVEDLNLVNRLSNGKVDLTFGSALDIFGGNEGAALGVEAQSFLRDQCKILVIGAGGLGCEILANLALLGFRQIDVIDMDTVDISNLNRQFLFRESDIGKSKAEAAAQFIMKRVPGVKVNPYHGKIQDKGDDYYLQFNIVICGLDSVDARRWISATLVNLVDEDNPESLKPLIDGGTEGFKGQARVMLPTITSCYECSLDMLTPPTAFPICTIANTPRLPEHCIEWASILEWPRVFKDKKLDNDDPEHIEWLYTRAKERADKYKIEGVTWSLTQGVVKRIIPAIASTNAIIAAACCNEAFKIATSSNPYLSNYMMYTGNDSIYTYTFEHQKKPECPVCGGEAVSISRPPKSTLQGLIDHLLERQDMQVKKPSLSAGDKKLYFQAPPQLEQATAPNLAKTLDELFESGTVLTVTDAGLPFHLNLAVTFDS